MCIYIYIMHYYIYNKNINLHVLICMYAYVCSSRLLMFLSVVAVYDQFTICVCFVCVYVRSGSVLVYFMCIYVIVHSCTFSC